MLFEIAQEKIMIRILSIALLLLTTNISFGAKKEVIIESQIKNVTVFLRGAQVERTSKEFLKPGVYTLIFPGLSQQITNGSVQVSGKGDLTILSVSNQVNYNREVGTSAEVQSLMDSLALLQEDLNYNRELKQVYEEEKSMILLNKKIDYGDQTGFAIEDIEDMSDFFRSRLKGLMDKRLDLQKEEKELQKEIARINGLINTKRQGSKRTSEVLVEVAVNSNTPAEFSLSYTVPNAGWSASYNVRAGDLGKPVSLAYNAKVYQSTGIDWEGVNMKLSTSDPSTSARKPNLSPWMLSFVNIGTYLQQLPGKSNRRFKMSADAEAMEDDAGGVQLPEITTAGSYTQVQESQLNVKYDIKLPYDIPSDGKTHTVNIRNEEFSSNFVYFTAPKMNQAAFLLAKVGGWENLNLLSGPANIYFEGTYVGASYINVQNSKTTLDLSMGIDLQVIVTRNRIKDYTETKILGNNKKETIGIEIMVKNTKSRPIEIRVQDQIPVSTDKGIEVEAEEFIGAGIKNETGIVTWDLKLAPGESKRLVLKYNVKYPKDQTINL